MDKPKTPQQLRTRLVHAGHDFQTSHGFVNLPAFRGSTVLYPNVAALKSNTLRYTYGRHGTPTTDALASAWTELSSAAGTALVPSGVAAIAMALQTALKSGDHLLMTDAAYLPARLFAERALRPLGIETTYYDPTIGAGVADLIRPNTRAIHVESPGSQSFEMQDVPAIAEAAHARGVCVILDNTWATPLLFPAHARGADLVIESGTKYLSGHSDLFLGLITADAEWWPRLAAYVDTYGIPPGPEDCLLALRGLRTMELRLREAERQALALAQWLETRPEVLRVLHPALPGHPGHAIWKRDYLGSSGLFTIVLKPAASQAVAAMLDGLELFGLGFSWGGYESLVIPFDCSKYRTATKWTPGGPTVRLQVGLEDIEDLKADLARGFERLTSFPAEG
jgi:cystathionine beta-lyase